MACNRIYPRAVKPPRQSFFLFGVRGVGKSTWARRQFSTAYHIDLLDEARFHELIADPALFASEVRANTSARQWVVVDEIQRHPGLLNEVHSLIEDRRQRFVLLGSSARKLKTAGTNLLAGRALWKTMFPLLPEELGADFKLERVLRFGSIPLIWQSPDARQSLEAYVQVYLREEVRAEALVRNLPGFARFLPIAALFHGEVINVSGIARDSGSARTTVSGYLDILEDTLLTYRLRAYQAKLRVRERKHPKLYWVDPGLVRAIKKQLGKVGAEEKGALFEGWVCTLLRAYGEERDLYDDLFYWAPTQASRVEVDFLLKAGRDLLAIEVKSQSRLASQHLSGLKAIADLPRLARRVLVYTGKRRHRTQDGAEILPVSDFAEALATNRLWP